MRIFPEMWANTLWPFSSSTRNMAFGSGSMTVPSRTIASSFGFGRDRPPVSKRARRPSGKRRRPTGLGHAERREQPRPTDYAIAFAVGVQPGLSAGPDHLDGADQAGEHLILGAEPVDHRQQPPLVEPVEQRG